MAKRYRITYINCIGKKDVWSLVGTERDVAKRVTHILNTDGRDIKIKEVKNENTKSK